MLFRSGSARHHQYQGSRVTSGPIFFVRSPRESATRLRTTLGTVAPKSAVFGPENVSVLCRLPEQLASAPSRYASCANLMAAPDPLAVRRLAPTPPNSCHPRCNRVAVIQGVASHDLGSMPRQPAIQPDISADAVRCCEDVSWPPTPPFPLRHRSHSALPARRPCAARMKGPAVARC